MNLLINEPPLQVLPTLAEAIGLNEAIFLQQLHYWLQRSNNWRDGRKWCYKTVEDWQQEFPFWSIATIKRIKTSLKKQNLILEGVFNRAGFDRTKWYSVNYEALEQVSCSMSSNCTNGRAQNEPSMSSICTNGRAQNDPTNTIEYTETTTEITQENNMVRRADQESLSSRFEKLWEMYPKKSRKKDAFNAYKRAVKKGTTDEEIKRGIENYKAQIKAQNTQQQYIAQGGTWFNQERWNDEYETHQTTGIDRYMLTREDDYGL